MELTSRSGNDRFLASGSYREAESRLRRHRERWRDVPVAVLSCFDRSTRLLPFVIYDRFIFPLGARSIAGALHEAGFENTRAVFQLWNPNFHAGQARLGGKPLEMLLVSSMQIHAGQAYEAVRKAWTLGDDRPLIIAGGPKAVYEPYHFWSIAGYDGEPAAPDVVVTGEQFVLLDLLNVVADHHRPGDTMRSAFERARQAGALNAVPGLVYLDPATDLCRPKLVDTGLQRLLQCFDEMPSQTVGLSLMEPPHRGTGLSPRSIPDARVRRHAVMSSLVVTQGCKFSCPYCPIPALNQKSWRYRSAESTVAELRGMYERYGIRYFFGADDNFFNHRPTAEELLTALAKAEIGGRRLGSKVRFSTEATQFDTYKNRDLLPLARRAGFYAMWFGIEDLTAELINKGQKPEVTVELFKLLHQQKIAPMAMLMYHEGQPFRTPGQLYGLANQVEFLRRAGAISIQCTVHTPAVGTREYENTYDTGRVVARLGDYRVPESKLDGNHVVVFGDEAPWRRQLKLLGGYAAFYNPLNFLRALKPDRSPLRKRRIVYQIVGLWATLRTGLSTLPYLLRLALGKPSFHAGPPAQTNVPVEQAPQAFARLPVEAHSDLLPLLPAGAEAERCASRAA